MEKGGGDGLLRLESEFPQKQRRGRVVDNDGRK
jgi:hypothetical protein